MIKIAYFSAEIGITSSLPTYSGGLGVLAGDHIKAAADAGLPLCGITLLYKEGYFKQRVDESGFQTETYPRYDPEPLLKKLPVSLSLPLRGRKVWIHAYELTYVGISGNKIPVYFLDTDVEENVQEDRIITLRLYSGDKDHRILQEAILGFGGILLLEALGHKNIETYHMNEGHCAFLTLELLKKFKGDESKVRSHCHFTTHTPVPSGHDNFAFKRCQALLDGLIPDSLGLPSMIQDERLHLTELGLYFSRSANAVSKLHQTVAQEQFPMFQIDSITNGVYHPYWVGLELRKLFDRRLPGWRENPDALLNIDSIPEEELLRAFKAQKKLLLGYVNSLTHKAFSNDVLTLVFARRAAAYKRANLIFSNPERLKQIGRGRLQIIFAGKAHPKDEQGKAIIHDIVEHANQLFGQVKITFVENYNLWLGRLITSGADVWLNTPRRPNEASGTSGMKAALNGVPNLSVLDGWWVEGYRAGKNGWAIGDAQTADDQADAEHLYDLLEREVVPVYYDHPEQWLSMRREAVKTGVHFSAYRMIHEYNQKFYRNKKGAVPCN